MVKVKEEIEPSDELYKMMETIDKEIRPNHEETKLINLRTKQKVKKVKIGAKLPIEENKKMIQLLKEVVDMFA